MDELMGTPGESHAAEPGGTWDLKRDLNGTGWKGDLHIHWQEHPNSC